MHPNEVRSLIGFALIMVGIILPVSAGLIRPLVFFVASGLFMWNLVYSRRQ